MILPSWKVRAGLVAGFLCALALIPENTSGAPGAGGGIGGSANKAPVIVSLEAQQVPGRKFQITGRVADETPGVCTVVISGVASGALRCDAGGNFSGVFDVANLGQIQAVASDGLLNSAPAYRTLTNSAPTIANFTAIGGPDNTWTFSGTVTDEAPAGLTVTLSGPAGVDGATATVGAGGGWSVTLTLAPGSGGNVTATVADWYGLTASAYTTFGG